MAVDSSNRLVIVVPVFEDWEAVSLLLPQLDEVLAARQLEAEVLLVDDGSRVPHDPALELPLLSGVRRLAVLELKRNLGHQRAIAVALAFVARRIACDAVVVMDGDGQDNPADIPRLVDAWRASDRRKLIFAARARRSESWLFQICYRLYQLLHLLLTGHRVRVGNFSLIPASTLSRVVILSELWSHYAAAVINARIDYTTVPAERGRRLGGRSRMNFTGLVVHGLSALSIYNQIIGVRLLVASTLVAAVLGGALAGMAALEWFSPVDVPWWPPLILILTLLLLLQSMVAGFALVLLALAGQKSVPFIPARDYRWFVGRTVVLHDSRQSAVHRE